MQASLRLIPAEFAISRHHFKNKEEKKRFLQSWRDNKPWSWYWDGWNFFWILNQFNLFYVASDFGNRLKAYEKNKNCVPYEILAGIDSRCFFLPIWLRICQWSEKLAFRPKATVSYVCFSRLRQNFLPSSSMFPAIWNINCQAL